MSYTYDEIKRVFIGLYGDFIYHQEFDSFDQAFRDAWNTFDYVANVQSAEEFCEGMTNCWQLTEY